MAKKNTLTQRHWLTLIMLATSFMILLFTITGKIISKKTEPEPTTFIFQSLESLSIDTWRAQQLDSNNQDCIDNANLLSSKECRQLFAAWRTLQPTAIIYEPSDMSQVLQVNLSFGNTSQQWYFSLNPTPRIIDQRNQQSLLIELNQVSQLFPKTVLNYLRQQTN